MIYLISYDIVSSNNRKKLSDLLISERFTRIQKSIFLATISSKKLEELMKNIEFYLEIKTDDLLVIPVCQEDFEKSIFLGQSFDVNQTTQLEKLLFL